MISSFRYAVDDPPDWFGPECEAGAITLVGTHLIVTTKNGSTDCKPGDFLRRDEDGSLVVQSSSENGIAAPEPPLELISVADFAKFVGRAVSTVWAWHKNNAGWTPPAFEVDSLGHPISFESFTAWCQELPKFDGSARPADRTKAGFLDDQGHFVGRGRGAGAQGRFDTPATLQRRQELEARKIAAAEQRAKEEKQERREQERKNSLAKAEFLNLQEQAARGCEDAMARLFVRHYGADVWAYVPRTGRWYSLDEASAQYQYGGWSPDHEGVKIRWSIRQLCSSLARPSEPTIERLLLSRTFMDAVLYLLACDPDICCDEEDLMEG